MLRNGRALHNITQLVLNCLCCWLVWYCTIYVRIILNPVTSLHVTAAQAGAWAPPLFLILPLWLATSFRLRIFSDSDAVRARSPLMWGFENALLLTTITAITTFFSRGFGEYVSRMFVPIVFPVAFLLLTLTRYSGLAVLGLAEKRWVRPLRVALVGDWGKAADVIKRIQATPANVIRGLIVPEAALSCAIPCPLPVLGTTSQIAELINRERLDKVIVLNASLSSPELAHCNQVFGRMGVPVSCALDLASEPVRVDVNTHYGLPFVDIVPMQFTRRQELVKRVFDLMVALLSLTLLAPVLLVLGAAIKLTSKGPILYKSLRVGKGGRHFMFLKFRSMYVDTDRSKLAAGNEKTGHIFKMRNDPRVTPIGAFLRRYSLDELPQLINVLRGEMSIVGPRPLPAADLDPDGLSEQFSAWSEGRARALPGLTGLWQVSGRSDLAFEDMVRLDLTYIQNWSLTLDIRIILDTPMLVLRGVGAY